ncbi:MAG: aldolase/citrate lyase family protein [Magnetovibrio sp.]|nr:aldolase/citrate lyase family protein [Magnetovibrio sp.]
MQETRVRRQWAAGRPALNGWLVTPAPLNAEVIAHQDLCSVTIDMQHGLIGYADAVAMLTATKGLDLTRIVRVPSLDAAIIGKALDAGADGVICPLINTAEEAARLVAACRYPPEGRRSFGPFRAGLLHGDGYFDRSRGHSLALAMIETAEALANLDAIAATPGLDALFVGPADLSIGLGHAPGFDRAEDDVVEAIGRIARAAADNGLGAGIYTTGPDYGRRMAAAGYNLITVVTDASLLAAGAGAARAALADLVDGG